MADAVICANNIICFVRIYIYNSIIFDECAHFSQSQNPQRKLKTNEIMAPKKKKKKSQPINNVYRHPDNRLCLFLSLAPVHYIFHRKRAEHITWNTIKWHSVLDGSLDLCRRCAVLYLPIDNHLTSIHQTETTYSMQEANRYEWYEVRVKQNEISHKFVQRIPLTECAERQFGAYVGNV